MTTTHRITFSEESLAIALNLVQGLHELSADLIASEVFRQQSEVTPADNRHATYPTAEHDLDKAEGAQPDLDILHVGSPCTAGAVGRRQNEAEGGQPDLSTLRLQVAERGSLLEHWLQLSNPCNDNLSDLAKETRALLDSEHPSWQQAARDVLIERRRQIFKGYTAAHDDHYSLGELTSYAVAHALIATGTAPGWVYQAGICQWQVKTEAPRTMLITAAALLLAELERIDRAAESAGIEAELLRLRQMMMDVTND